MKLVINRCFGGFGLSHKAVMRYAELKGIKLYAFVQKRDGQGCLEYDKYEPYTNQKGSPLIHYHTQNDPTLKSEGYFSDDDIERTDPALVQAVKELGKRANGQCADLNIVKIPEGVAYEIDEYDGLETVHEKHRSWS